METAARATRPASQEEPRENSRELIPCHHCGAAFDPLTADWCGRTHGAPTLMCPHCGHCFCRTDGITQRAIWQRLIERLNAAEAEREARALTPAEESPDHGYEITCPQCEKGYDAALAAECDCAVAARTRVCPHCKKCFCAAPLEVQIGFWVAAPEPLRAHCLNNLEVGVLGHTAAGASPAAEAPARPAFRKAAAGGGEQELVDLAAFLNPERHEVRCRHCQADYNALEASWCYCLGAERSLLCPACLRCFCKESKEFRQHFWAEAPVTLRAKRVADLRQPFWPPVPPPLPGELTPPTVLVATSDLYQMRIAGRALGLLGCSVLYARDGLQAHTLVKSHRPELLLTDAILPRLNGRELARRVKTDPSASYTKVAITTALYTQPSHRDEAFKIYKVDAYLIQPVDIHQLRDALEKLLPAKG